jgi:hypothetical protein
MSQSSDDRLHSLNRAFHRIFQTSG